MTATTLPPKMTMPRLRADVHKSRAQRQARPFDRNRKGAIWALLVRHGPQTADDLSSRLPIGKCGLRHHLQALEDEGRVRSRLETFAELDARKRQKGTPTNARRRLIYSAHQGEA